jgi:hypothetical protein
VEPVATLCRLVGPTRHPMKTMLSAAIAIVVSTVHLCSPAGGHSWYPQECCSGRDCAPVEKINWLVLANDGLPQLVVTSAIGTAVIPHDMPERGSKDGRMHVCIQDVWAICLFIPPQN